MKLAAGIALLSAAAIALLAVLDRSAPEPEPREPRPSTGDELPRLPDGRPFVVDVHVHLAPDATERLEQLMGRWHFDHVVNLSGGHPGRGLEEQLAAAKRAKGRVSVFTTLPYREAMRPGYGERMAQKLREAAALGARGLKIAKALGLGMPGPDGKLLPVDDPGLDPVFEAAGELGLPVAIHSGDPRAFWQPVDASNERADELRAHPGWSNYGEPVPSFDEILAQLERRVARHPKTKFISVHFGNCAEDPDRVARWLRRYPNLYIDTAARIPEMGRHPPEKMRAFFVEFQDRILYGSDLGVGPEPEPLFLGSEGPEPATEREEKLFFGATRRYFESADRDFDHPTPIQGKWKISGVNLPRDVLVKIYAKNAMRLIKLDLPAR